MCCWRTGGTCRATVRLLHFTQVNRAPIRITAEIVKQNLLENIARWCFFSETFRDIKEVLLTKSHCFASMVG